MQERKPWQFLEEYRGEYFKGEWPTLPEMFRISATRHASRPCLTVYDPDRISYTYGEALDRIERLAAYLSTQGVHRGDKVAVSGKNSPEWAVAYLGIQFAGATVVPIDYQLKNEEVEAILKASDAVGFFVDEEKFEAFDPSKIGLKARWSLSKAKPEIGRAHV